MKQFFSRFRHEDNNQNTLVKRKFYETYSFVFLVAFGIMFLIILPIVIYNGGYMVYYGDFNSQQLPFYYHVNEAIKNGGLFGYDWGTDLGSPLLTSYSFYNTGSPFFWITLLFPTSFTLYIMPLLLAIKTGVAAVTSFAFIKRFVKSRNACFIGAMLYAFSGFQAYNVFFNHFHDATALFPLLLLALEMNIQDNKKGVFALTVAICAVTNYYFFIAEVVFLIIYFIIRCLDKKFKITLKKFLLLAFESVAGVFMACIILVPSYYAIVTNPRTSTSLYGEDMIAYSDKFRILRIIQSFFMMPDPAARPNLFNSDTAKWASIAGYLPMFSMAGVIAFMRTRKKHFATILIYVCILFAFVPVLNSSFQLFNNSYYARWFFMPILIMCMMTATALDDSQETNGERKVSLKKGIPITVCVTLGFLAIFFLPTYDSVSEKVKFFDMAKYIDLYIVQAAVTIVLLALLIFIVYYLKRNKKYLHNVLILTCVASFVFMTASVYYGVAQGPERGKYTSQAIEGEVNLPKNDNEFYRIETSENTDNYPMFWGYSTMRCFNSTVSTSIMDFYDMLGIERDVASRPGTVFSSLRNALSVKYFMQEEESKTKELSDSNTFVKNEMTGFKKIDSQNGFDIYENTNYIPMGYVIDTYVTEDDLTGFTTDQKTQVILSNLVMTDEQGKKYSDIINKASLPGNYSLNTNMIALECSSKKAQSCSEFITDTDGFSAKISLEKDKMVFFSVPYDEGFSATVNGKSIDIEKVDGGLMAIRCNEGDNDIRFDFELKGLTEGLIISFIGIVLFTGYMITVILKNKTRKSTEKIVSVDHLQM